MVSILVPVFVSLVALVAGVVGARVVARRFAPQHAQASLPMSPTVADDPDMDLPAFVDRTDAAAVAAYRQANLEVSQSWGKTY
jgi:hypothetical protein